MIPLERIRKDAEIWFTDGTRCCGCFFLEPATPSGEGPQTLFALLNSSRRYLPLEVESGEVLLIQKHALVLARSALDPLIPGNPYAKTVPVAVELLTGETLQGTIAQDLPASFPRLSDFLNFSPQFFALRIEGWDCILNSDSVSSVRPISGPSDEKRPPFSITPI